MNLRRFSIYIMVIGLLTIGGGLVYFLNSPEITMGRSSRSLSNILWFEKENRRRANARSTSVKMMIGGSVVSILGIGLLTSSPKKNKESL
jgi:hypothetical protein